MKTERKILIGEDELLIAKVLRMLLEKQGFVVENVADGNEVFERALQMQPDVIILDLHLKNSTCGLEAGKKIRAAGIETPIIFTTGNSYEITLETVKEISCCSVMSKPVEFKKLLEVIHAL